MNQPNSSDNLAAPACQHTMSTEPPYAHKKKGQLGVFRCIGLRLGLGLTLIVILSLALSITTRAKIDQLADITVKMYAYSIPTGQTPRDLLERSQSVKQQLLTIMSALLLVISGTAILVGILITRGITRPLRRIRENIRHITHGNVNHRIDLDRQDELGELATALDQMIDKAIRQPAQPIAHQELPQDPALSAPAEHIMTDKTIESLFTESCEMIQTVSKDILSLTSLYEPKHLDMADILDWDQLVEGLGDEDTVREVIPPCLNDMQSHVGELSQALACEDYRAIVFHTHAIKGAGQYLGIERVTKLATRMEYAGQENDLLASVEYFNDLKPQIEKVLVALSQDNWIELAKIAHITRSAHGSGSQRD